MQPEVLADLGDGLLLCRASIADVDELVAFNADVHRYGDPEPSAPAAAWTRDAILGTLPGAANTTVVRQGQHGPIVSTLCIIAQTWTIEGIAVGVGRVETVGTHPDFRNRGLVRRQMAVVHEWSAARGELMQVVGGRPCFYRQFGYEPAIDQESGWAGHVGPVAQAMGRLEGYRVRPATEADLGCIAAIDEDGAGRYAVHCRRDAAVWQHELSGMAADNPSHRELRVVEAPGGARAGYLAHDARLWDETLNLIAFEMAPGRYWRAAAAAVLSYLGSRADEYALAAGKPVPPRAAFRLGREHPAYAFAASVLTEPVPHLPWYVRVPDLAALLRRIAPALEWRLAGSPSAGYSGALWLTFYTSALRLTFDQGRLSSVEATPPTEEASAGLPGLTFLQLLFGYRDLDEVRHAFPDCWAEGVAERLLRALFPRRPSLVWPIG